LTVLGIEAEVLPWDRPQLLASIALSFTDTVAQQTTSDPLQQGLKILRKNLREKIVDRTSAMKFRPATHAGYRQQSAGATSMVVHTPAFGG
jgi:hypothetical protein